MTNTPIKILVIGEYSIFRSGLRMLLETDTNLRIIGEASKLETAQQIVEEESPDLILVDLPDLAEKDHFSFLENVTIPVLVLVGKYDAGVYQRCLTIGVRGLVLKEENADTLFKAIAKIHDGEIWFDRMIMGQTILQLVSEKRLLKEYPKAHVTNALTEREKQVVDLICRGMKNKDIADELFITETTVRHHLTSVFNKLEISSRLELVIYAFKNSLVMMPSGNGSFHGNGRAVQQQSALVG